MKSRRIFEAKAYILSYRQAVPIELNSINSPKEEVYHYFLNNTTETRMNNWQM